MPATQTQPSRWLTAQSLALDTHSQGPKILAAGLWRRATSSLQIAFETILDAPSQYAPLMHGTYVLTSKPLLKLCVRASRETDKFTRQAMLREIFSGYNASSDYLGMAFVEDLVEMYPDLKIVLNRRISRESWAKSANATLRFFLRWTYALICGLLPTCYWHWQLYRNYERLAKRRFGEDVDVWGPKYCDLHLAWVRAVGEKANKEILEWGPEEGWRPLCQFLGTEVPSEKFPRVSDVQEIDSLKAHLLRSGLVAWLALLTSLTLLVAVFDFAFDVLSYGGCTDAESLTVLDECIKIKITRADTNIGSVPLH